MRLLITTGIYPPDIGGPADYVKRFAGFLHRSGLSVRVVCWSDVPNQDDTGFPVARIDRRRRFRRIASTLWAIYRDGKDRDVWFVNGLPVLSQLLASTLSKSTIHKVVGDGAWELAVRRGWYSGTIDEYQTTAKSVRLRLLDRLRTLPLRRASQVIVPSEYLARIVRSWGIDARRIRVVRNSTAAIAADPEFSLPSFEGKTLTTVCRLVPWKGVDGIIRAVSGLPDTRLVVAGDGPLRSELSDLAARLGVAERVLFLGNVSRSQVRALLERTHVFVLNSSYEGLPHVVLEAMEAGAPVVATDVGGTPEVIATGQTGLLIPYGDPRALGEAIGALLHDPAFASKLAREAKRVVDASFSERACFEQTQAVLEVAARK
jgi:glycosyltransferase involved in cell wall biosynthesis